MIPILDLKVQYQNLKTEIDAAMQSVAAGGHYILGPHVKALERDLALRLGAAGNAGAARGIGVASGSDALHLALRALRLGPGDDVITTPFTFIATTEAICLSGATPVFADIEADTLNISVAQIAKRITPRTKAIWPVHLYGQPCDMAPLMNLARKHNLFVVEDCAQAIGARYDNQAVGTFGDVGCFSFFPSKNLGCFGDGGMCLTNDEEVGERIEYLRRHGGKVKYHHAEIGLNSRLDELQAAILRVKLPHLEQWNEARRRLAHRYSQLLADVPQIQVLAERPNVRAVYHQFTILVDQRNTVHKHLQEVGVQTMIYYPVPLHLQEIHADLGYKEGDFPVAENAAARCLSLPMYPELTEGDQDTVVAALKAAVR